MSRTQVNSLFACSSASTRACMSLQEGIMRTKSPRVRIWGALPVWGTAASVAPRSVGRNLRQTGAAVGESGAM